ncbi:MAG: MATE family efflux transporter [Candidatus Borkfalkiaceae bacterium]|nr:MATE family efflux transporter [Christensenellaceae bacterium]
MKGVRLSDHFTYKKLFKAVLSPILMMVFTSIYGIVDGLFISNVEGDTAFSAVNLIIPVTMAIGAIGFMFGAGGSALVSKTLGEGDKDKAQSIFTAIVIINAAVGFAISVLTFIFVEQIVTLLGATPEMKDYAVKYGRIILIGEIAFMTQNLFQNFFIVAERPHLGFIVTVGAGVTNMILDAMMVAVLRLGVEGAAIATVISQVVGSVIPIIYFAKKNTSLLRFRKPAFRTDYIFKTVTNGFSEFLSNVSASFVSMVYNKQLMSYRGQDGVTAYGIIMYASFIFAAVFIGYAIGTAPIIGYNYGAQNHDELKNVFKKSMILNFATGIVMTTLSVVFAKLLCSIFVGYNPALLDFSAQAMRIFSIGFIFMGLNIFTSSFFTALNNGLISAIVSAFRTLVCQLVMVFTLPIIWGVDGIWISIVAAEALALCLDIVFLITNRKKYHY